MFARMEITERRTHKTSMGMMGVGLLGILLTVVIVNKLPPQEDNFLSVVGGGICLFLLCLLYSGTQRHVNAEMWRQAASYASQYHWYLCDVCPVVDIKSKQTYLRIQLIPGALNGFTQVRRHYISQSHPDYPLLSQFQEEDVTMLIPLRLTCIAPEVIGKQQPERLFDLLRIHLL